MANPAGYLALILHAHLPYVRPEGPEILEERWLYEAVAESYLPLLWTLAELEREGVPCRLAISFSAPLLAMLADAGLMRRCRDHLERTTALARREADRLAGTPLGPAAAFHRDRYRRLAADLDARDGRLLPGFASLADSGLVELFTAAGSHGFLPLLATDEGRAAQLDAGLAEFERAFGRRPAGIWLPECAYAPGLDHLLSARGLGWFVAESTAAAAAWPPVPGVPYLPVRTPGGVAAFARDIGTAGQVWSSRGGYPGDFAYREFYRDVGYTLPVAELAPWLVDGHVRSDTGLKFYRITGPGEDKAPYDPARALARTAEHARHLAGRLAERSAELAAGGGWGRAGGPVFVAPFDAELFGHWWFEGPAFIGHLFRALQERGAVAPVSPSDYLAVWPDPPVARLPGGTWGEEGDNRVWLSPANDWVWPGLHAAELAMRTAARSAAAGSAAGGGGEAGAAREAQLSAAARQLLLAQASDWPFNLYRGTAADYARRRVSAHLDRFRALLSGEGAAADLAADRGIFPDLDWRVYAPPPGAPAPAAGGPLRVLMLSWEFPPANVGGLGRHVYDLGEALGRRGHTVCVITLADPGAAARTERVGGMTVYRVPRPPEGGDFPVWVWQFNQALVQAALAAAAAGGPFQVVHSHDWLVGQAGMALQARWRVPLVGTIHATEKGRQNGIYEDMQQVIHEEEWYLSAAARQLITVSRAMAAEVSESFRVPPERLHVIYNGVAAASPADPRLLGRQRVAVGGEPYLFFIGRLVREKGVQVAIEALSRVAAPLRLVVAGRGPQEPELRNLAQHLGVADRVHFVGRVTDAEKGAWLQGAAAGLVPSLYEPFGIVALEVMAAGVPVVVSATGGLSEIVADGVDGCKVPPGDAAALADAISGLVADPGRAGALAAAGLAKAAEQFGWGAIAAQTEAVYRLAWR